MKTDPLVFDLLNFNSTDLTAVLSVPEVAPFFAEVDRLTGFGCNYYLIRDIKCDPEINKFMLYEFDIPLLKPILRTYSFFSKLDVQKNVEEFSKNSFRAVFTFLGRWPTSCFIRYIENGRITVPVLKAGKLWWVYARPILKYPEEKTDLYCYIMPDNPEVCFGDEWNVVSFREI